MTSLTDKTINNSLTRSNSVEIADWSFPDYSAGVTMQYATDFTLPCNGYILMVANGHSNGSDAQVALEVKDSNGTILYTFGNRFQNSTISTPRASCMIPLKKGTIVQGYGGSIELFSFYPVSA